MHITSSRPRWEDEGGGNKERKEFNRPLVAEKGEEKVVLTHDFDLKNHSGTEFKVGVKRTVSLLDGAAMRKLLRMAHYDWRSRQIIPAPGNSIIIPDLPFSARSAR